MKIILARPPRRDANDRGLCVPPLGLAYLAGALREQGMEVSLLDAYALNWSWPRFEAAIRKSRPQVLGLSAMTPTADVAYRSAELLRDAVPWILLGGPHPTAVRERVFEECSALDHAVVGEGEEVLPELIRWLERGCPDLPPPGVLSPGHPFRPHTPSRSLDDLPLPARDLLPRSAYRYLLATRPGFATMITSRGCPFRCSFCDKSVSGSRWRARSPVSVVDELEQLQRAGVGFVNFYDDNFTLLRRRVVDICEEILRRGLSLEWKCEARVDGVDLPLLRLMRRAGCRVVAYGVESGNRETLALLRKDVTLEGTIRAFSLTREAGLRSMAYMILGAPGEGHQEVERSVRFVRELGASYVQFSSLTAFPNTPLFEEHTGVQGQARGPLDSDLSRVTISQLPAEDLDRLMKSAWRRFYLRPRPLGRLARDAWRSGSLGELMRMGWSTGRWALSPQG